MADLRHFKLSGGESKACAENAGAVPGRKKKTIMFLVVWCEYGRAVTYLPTGTQFEFELIVSTDSSSVIFTESAYECTAVK